MENISRIDINKIITILESSEEGKKLAEKMKKAKIIENLYVATYVRAVNTVLKKLGKVGEEISMEHDFEGMVTEYPHLNLEHIQYSKTKIEAVKTMFRYAVDRESLICDFDDTKHPLKIIGSCQYENHYDDLNVEEFLNEEQMKEFDKINEEHGWHEACEKFSDILNPDNQELTIALGFDYDQAKYEDGDPEYYCKRCMEEANENADGYGSCDMEDLDE